MFRNRFCNRISSRFFSAASNSIQNDGCDYFHISTLIGVRFPHLWFPAAREMKRRIICHIGPTNSGKTHKAIESLSAARCGLYCAPLRLLSWEIADRLNKANVPCHLVTGQEQDIVVGGNHISCTVEVADLLQLYNVAVIDEMQMIADDYRGWAWTRAFLGVCAEELHVCGSESFLPIVQELCKLTNETVEVHRYERLGKLTVGKELADYRDVMPGDALISFSRRTVLHTKTAIDSNRRNKSKSTAVIYGALPPETRREQAKLFNTEGSGLDALAATDAIGMGLNLQIRRVVFQSLHKFDGIEMRQLTHHEIRQIAGRAGRFGSKYPDGEVTVISSLKNGLSILSDALKSADVPLTRAGIRPTWEQVERFYGGSVAELPPGYASDIQSRISSLLKATLTKVKSKQLSEGDANEELEKMKVFFDENRDRPRVRPMTQAEREDKESNYLAMLWHKQSGMSVDNRNKKIASLKGEMVKLTSLANLIELFHEECGLKYHRHIQGSSSFSSSSSSKKSNYFVCDSSEFIAMAKLLEGLKLPLQDGFVFCLCPCSVINRPLKTAWFRRYAQSYSENRKINFDISCERMIPAHNSEELHDLESVSEITSMYIWLCYKYPESFVDLAKATAQRSRISNLIDASLLGLKRSKNLSDIFSSNDKKKKKGRMSEDNDDADDQDSIVIPSTVFYNSSTLLGETIGPDDGIEGDTAVDLLNVAGGHYTNMLEGKLKKLDVSSLSSTFRGELIRSNIFSVFKKL